MASRIRVTSLMLRMKPNRASGAEKKVLTGDGMLLNNFLIVYGSAFRDGSAHWHQPERRPLSMNRPKLSYNLLSHMRQKVVLIDSWSQCAAKMAWRLSMNLEAKSGSKLPHSKRWRAKPVRRNIAKRLECVRFPGAFVSSWS